jgi:hypothetical protein
LFGLLGPIKIDWKIVLLLWAGCTATIIDVFLKKPRQPIDYFGMFSLFIPLLCSVEC